MVFGLVWKRVWYFRVVKSGKCIFPENVIIDFSIFECSYIVAFSLRKTQADRCLVLFVDWG